MPQGSMDVQSPAGQWLGLLFGLRQALGILKRRGHQMLDRGPGAVVGVRPEMAVGGQRGVRRRVPEGPLDGDDVAARGAQAARVLLCQSTMGTRAPERSRAASYSLGLRLPVALNAILSW